MQILNSYFAMQAVIKFLKYEKVVFRNCYVLLCFTEKKLPEYSDLVTTHSVTTNNKLLNKAKQNKSIFFNTSRYLILLKFRYNETSHVY